MSRSMVSRVFPAVALAILVAAPDIADAAAAARPARRDDRVDRPALDRIRTDSRERWQRWRGAEFRRLLTDRNAPSSPHLAGVPRTLQPVGVTDEGRPLYLQTSNVTAARTVSADRLWPDGVLGLLLGGENEVGELGIWDAGRARPTHQEFEGRLHVGNAGAADNFHATHVAGTIIGSGVHPEARGMSPAGQATSYDWEYDDEEMAGAATAGLLLSNHSYGYVCGWNWNPQESVWYWYGDTGVSEVEDVGFGFYGTNARAWDQIAVAAPDYLIVKAAGNDRSTTGPEPGGGHYVYNRRTGWQWSTVTRQADGADGGYDTIGYRGNAKNILTVGAVADIPAGYAAVTDVVMSSFSSWGPTDDGRIKPDLVANGIGLYSALDGADDDYASLSGTSMATPSVTGTLNLLVQHYRATQAGRTPLAATLKALVLHTADEAGASPGPDYSFGWGLLNATSAANVISASASDTSRIQERKLAPGQADTLRFVHDGSGTVRATICWTDPAGPTSEYVLDSPTLRLVHDLDLRVVRASDGQEFMPWVLDPAQPAAPATTGDNDRDNVEQVLIDPAETGTYLVIVSHEGSLQATQDFSLVITGLEATSAPTAVGDLPQASGLALRAAPNPFNPRTVISFELTRPGAVTLAIHALDGRRVATLVAGETLAAGPHTRSWDGRDDRGQRLGSGTYLARMTTGAAGESVKLMLVK
ncbi:MAG: S8 family serine peptidase [Candidatus Krumholzibacteriia bacterium]